MRAINHIFDRKERFIGNILSNITTALTDPSE